MNWERLEIYAKFFGRVDAVLQMKRASWLTAEDAVKRLETVMKETEIELAKTTAVL